MRYYWICLWRIRRCGLAGRDVWLGVSRSWKFQRSTWGPTSLFFYLKLVISCEFLVTAPASTILACLLSRSLSWRSWAHPPTLCKPPTKCFIYKSSPLQCHPTVTEQYLGHTHAFPQMRKTTPYLSECLTLFNRIICTPISFPANDVILFLFRAE